MKTKRVQFSTYCGRRNAKGECEVRVINGVDGDSSFLPLRLDLANHSPTGFEWGYGGSGPAQLALAILAHVFSHAEDQTTLNEDLAVHLHQRFKRDVIANLDRKKPWCLKEQDIIDRVRIILLTGNKT